MSETESLKAQLAGVMIVQQAILEALVRADAIGYPQLRATLAEALAALDGSEGVAEESLRPLRHAMAMIDDLHAPHEPGRSHHAADWAALMGRIGGG